MILVALDLGTSSVKAVLVDDRLDVVRRAVRAYPTRSPEPGMAEQDPDEVLRAAAAALRELGDGIQTAPSAIVLSSAMHSVMALDRDGRPSTPLLIWADGRGGDEARALRAGSAASALEHRTGTPVDASSPLCKLQWLWRHQRERFERAAAFVSMKEYLLRQWCGAAVVDESVASATGLWDLARRRWDGEALGLARLVPERLSEVVPTRHVLRGVWRPGLAARIGIPADLPIVVGATDGVLANVGVGATGGGIVATTLGSSAAARAVVAAPRAPAGSGLFCYVLDRDLRVIGGAVNNAGLAVDWLGRLLFGDAPGRERDLLAAAAESPPGSRGVRCQPWLAGERFPDYDSSLRGAFEGLSLAHGRADLARALLEGVVGAVARVVAALATATGGVRELRAGGGLVEAPLVGQMLADRTGCRVYVPASVESSALGAARLARVALGLEESLVPGPEVAIARSFAPDPVAARIYAALD